MSTLKTNTIQHLTSGFNNIVTHTDGAGTVNAAHCRAWVNFDGTGTPSIRASFNVSSITDNGTGDYTANFTNAMSDTNYTFTSGGHNTGAGDGGWISTGNGGGAYPAGVNTGSVRIHSFHNTNGGYQDNAGIFITIHR
jgi:hypothetical protein